MNTQAMQDRLKTIGSDLVGPDRRSPEYLAKYVPQEIERWGAVIRDVIASGSIHRGDYGMDRWTFALSDKVRFLLRVRVREPAGTRP